KRVSEYEGVREFFTSTTVVLIVDLLFLFIFLLVITVLAGWLVMVPITGIALMFLAGRTLQRGMAQVTIDAQTDSSLQHSVLVESIGAQETLKAVRAEGRMLGRWRRYSEMSAATQEKLRGLGAISVNLTIKPGERIGIIGRVASGKSTLGRVLSGLYEPTEGTYLIDGLDSRQHHPQQVRGAFRFVGQDAELFSGTVRDNLTLGTSTPDDARLIEAVHRSGAHIFLARDASGFDLSVGERGSRLSGGQRSFLVLARALVEPCKLLYLDEPTGAMDQQTEAWFIEHLGKALAPDQ